MASPRRYQSDLETILKKRYENGADLWATPDKKIGKGSPFSTRDCVIMLTELGMDPSEEILKDTARLIFSLWREDGRFRTAPKGAIYPCHTITTSRILCSLGYTSDSRLEKTLSHLLDIQHNDGGWRCKKFIFGRGPETEFSNPGPTLEALDAFRFTKYLNNEKRLDSAVDFLLNHWEIRKPLGPCHFGIGSLFLKIEYPFFRYNLFYYVHTLSFYTRAQNDIRFLSALEFLESKMKNGKIIVENPNKRIAHLNFCKKGQPSELATKRYTEIKKNLGQ